MSLAAKIVAVHEALDRSGIPHAFGGALALAWCTQRARGTIDIDLNVFVEPAGAADVLRSLPREVRRSGTDAATLERDGQIRLWWDETPLDVFLNTTPYHDDLARRTHCEPFAGAEVPFLGCTDLAVFKAFFDRTKDWADLEEMVGAGTLDREAALGILVEYLGPDDPRIVRLRELPAAALGTP